MQFILFYYSEYIMKNMMRNEALRIALIDYENCCNLRNISLADYT
ncbi:hypothetical protein ECBCE011MS01_4628 [Escherichia coli BCE011_MS-01]|nr:hypothetical protein ECBCE011MS01_4628 [Escherichia coli BCE011_MS-01]